MSERQKLNLGGFASPRERPDRDALMKVSEEAGFPSRDPRPPAGEGAPAAERASAVAPAPAPMSLANFRRPGRPPSDRLIAINVRVSQDTAEAIYRLRDSKPRQSLADAIDLLVKHYEESGTPDI